MESISAEKPDKKSENDAELGAKLEGARSKWAKDAEKTMLERYDNSGKLKDASGSGHPEEISQEAFGHLKQVVEKFYKGSELLGAQEREQAIEKGMRGFEGESTKNDANMYLHIKNSFENVLNDKQKKERGEV